MKAANGIPDRRTIPPAEFRFTCIRCHTELVLPNSSSVKSGPCPRCQTWIDASSFSPSDGSIGPATTAPDDRSAGKGSRSLRANHGRIRADGFLDHGHTERREFLVTLRIFGVALIVFAVLAIITLYMRQWISE